MKKEKKHSNLS